MPETAVCVRFEAVPGVEERWAVLIAQHAPTTTADGCDAWDHHVVCEFAPMRPGYRCRRCREVRPTFTEADVERAGRHYYCSRCWAMTVMEALHAMGMVA